MGNNSKYNCGTIVPTSCSPYTGPALTFLSTADLEAFPCDANANDVIGFVDKYLKILVDGNNFSQLDLDCFEDEIDDLSIATAFDLHQVEFNQLCILKGQVEAIQTLVEELEIGSEQIEIDLDCMTPDASPCEIGTNLYTLQTVLQTIVSKVCDHENRLLTLES